MTFVIQSAAEDSSVLLEAVRNGAYDYLQTPFESEALLTLVRRALEHRRLTLENRGYQAELQSAVEGRTEQLRKAIIDLERSYDVTSRTGNALSFRLNLGKFFFTNRFLLEDREFDCPGRVEPVLLRGKQPDHMIQARSEMMDDLSSEDAESNRNLAVKMNLRSFLKRLIVVIAGKGDISVIDKLSDLGIQIDDVLVGPF